MKTISPQITKENAAWYAAEFKSTNAGALKALAWYPLLYKYTIAKFYDLFDVGEMSLLVDSFNATKIMPDAVYLRTATLTAHVRDAIKLDGLAEKWKINGAYLLAKVKHLAPAECYFLMELCNGFWYHKPNEKPNLEEFLSPFKGE